MLSLHRSVYCRSIRKNLMLEDDAKSYRLTPFIITFSDAGLTSIDMENFIEMGLRIIRFTMSKLTHNDKITLLAKFREACKVYCSKYGVDNWPIAISIDVPNACIKTGSLNNELGVDEIILEDNSMINVTCNKKYWNKCSKDIIFMDDPFTFPSIKLGTEITLGCGKVVMFCIQIINKETIKCKIVQGGRLSELEAFCVRGVRHVKPPLSNYDLKMIDFAKEHKLDIIIMNSVRYPITLTRVRKLFKNHRVPHIISTICEQEGLDNIDDIIEMSDGIILAREFLAYEIVNQYRMVAIQKQISGKCKLRGKPFFVSGNILEESLKKGIITDRDLYDITNTAMDNTGFILKELHDPSHLLVAMDILDSVCRSVESTNRDADFWRILDELKMPVNAAEACCQACALVARQTKSKVIIVPTVSGKTARCLSHIAPEVTIFTITSNPATARKLQLYRGILSIIYNANKDQSFEEAMGDRVNFAVCYCITRNMLNYKDTYVVLRRSTMYCAYPDNLSVGTVNTKSHTVLQCPSAKVITSLL
ncbi:PREDICTED: pyruvate kinase-like [Papilio polytes]|uniref:pyruvate kinase-like n=1 Tax=Papilio polytes TaxID=76194 RepID=UPI000676B01D|nr:PREDICTED: pyruvate kinase-like [Papilio polytes]